MTAPFILYRIDRSLYACRSDDSRLVDARSQPLFREYGVLDRRAPPSFVPVSYAVYTKDQRTYVAYRTNSQADYNASRKLARVGFCMLYEF